MRRGADRLLSGILETLERQGMAAEIEATPDPGTAGHLARSLVSTVGVRRILVAGGDGTINEVLNGIGGLSVEMGILPAGTANVLANELGISHWRKAVESVGTWVPHRIPVGVIESVDGHSRRFLMMAGAGFDARLVYSVNPALKRSVGKLAYWFAGFSQLGRTLEQMRIIAGGRVLRGSFCLASRVRNYGGDLNIAPSIRLMDNDLEVVCFEGTITATYLAHLASILAGRVAKTEGITVFRARELELQPAGDEPVHVQVDGEHAGYLPLRVQVQPDALTFLVPPGYLSSAKEKAA